MWQEPSLLLLHPTISAALRRFRAHGLPQAMINGAAEGLTGAIWPWESASSNGPSPRCRLTQNRCCHQGTGRGYEPAPSAHGDRGA